MKVDLTRLSENEVEILTKILGKAAIEDMARERRPAKKTTLKPYKLQIVSLCSTCGTLHTAYYNMVLTEKGDGLISQRTDDPNNVDVAEERNRLMCENCKTYLMSLEKEELVDKYMKLLVRRW